MIAVWQNLQWLYLSEKSSDQSIVQKVVCLWKFFSSYYYYYKKQKSFHWCGIMYTYVYGRIYCLRNNAFITLFSCSIHFRLRAGNVIFNYRYYNNRLQKTEGVVFLLLTIVSFVFHFLPIYQECYLVGLIKMDKLYFIFKLIFFLVWGGVLNTLEAVSYHSWSWLIIVLLLFVIFLPLIHTFLLWKMLVPTFWCSHEINDSFLPCLSPLYFFLSSVYAARFDSLVCPHWVFSCSNWRLLLSVLLG